jgi:hypothetical protein
MLIERAIPRNMVKGGEGQRLQAALLSPVTNMINQGTPDALALALRGDADLFDVSTIIDLVNKHKANYCVVIVNGYPSESDVHIGPEDLGGHQLSIGNVIETNFTKALATSAFHLTNLLDFVGSERTDREGHPSRLAHPLPGRAPRGCPVKGRG